MSNDFYRKLVDLYAAGELPQELKDELEAAAITDKELSHDMATLTTTVETLQSMPKPEFTEESFQRVLIRLYTKGAPIQTHSPDPGYLQFHLPLQG